MMRRLTLWLPFVVLAWGCGTNSLPFAPSAAPSPFTPSVVASVDSDNWSPWFFSGWQPGIGRALALGTSVDAMVDVGDECVPNLRWTWDARASCKRFTVSVPSEGRLDAFLRWDDAAPGFDPTLSGDVVLVAPNGRFTASDWQHADEHIFAFVQPGEYGVLVMSYVPASLPFQIRTEFRSN